MSDQPLQFCHRKGLTIRTDGETEVFEDEETGLRIRGYGTNVSVFPPAHTLVIEREASHMSGRGCVAFEWERQFYPSEIPEGWQLRPPMSDTTKVTSQTGGARRGYVSESLARVLASNISTLNSDYWTERAWLMGQLDRPLSHVPMQVAKGNQYSAYDTIAGWTNMQKTPDGRNAWDPQHHITGRMFPFASAQEPLACIVHWLNWRWYAMGTYRKTNWRSAPRGAAGALLQGVEAFFMDYGVRADTADAADVYCDRLDLDGSIDPKDYLKECWAQLEEFQPERQEVPQELPKLEPSDDWDGFGPQLAGEKPYQEGMYLWGLVRLIESNILPGSKTQIEDEVNRIVKRLTDTALEDGGFSYIFGTTVFPDQATAQRAVDEGGMDGLRVVRCRGGGWNIRKGPARWSEDNALIAAPVAWMDPEHELVTTYLASKEWGTNTKYDLVTAAVLERAQMLAARAPMP